MLFHQADKLLLAPLVTPIMEDFQINEAQMGAVSNLAICLVAWLICGFIFLGLLYTIPKDIEALRRVMRARASVISK